MASSTPGAGRADSASSKRTLETATSWWQAHEVLLEGHLGAVGQLHAGADRIVGHRHQVDVDAPGVGQLVVTSLRVAPSASRWVRKKWVAMSLSPSRNHVSPPSFSSASITVQDSPASPHPVSALMAPARV